MLLHDGLAKYALISAFEDSRFREISRSELPRLQCGWVFCCYYRSTIYTVRYILTASPRISLLTNFEQANSYLDWTIGVHGIYITFSHPSLLESSSEAPSPYSSTPNLPTVTSKQRFTATYLPDVIPDQGWTKIEAIDSAIHKAGWRGPITEVLRRSLKLERYQSSKCTVTWKEYLDWRKNHEGNH